MKFNENERVIIKELVKYDNISQSTIGRFLDERIFTSGKGIVIMALIYPLNLNSTINCTILYYDAEKFKNKEVSDMIYKVIESLLIFNKLEKMGLVSMMQFPNLPQVTLVGCSEKGNLNPNPGVAVEFKNSNQYITTKLEWKDEHGNVIYNNMKIEDSILNTATLFNSIIWVSPELKELVKHNFQTEDNRKFKKQQKLTWLAIAVAILMPIFISLFGTTKIDSTQLEQVTNKIETVNQSINKHITGTLEGINNNDMRRDSIDMSKRVGTIKK